jgi:hypothetical protein
MQDFCIPFFKFLNAGYQITYQHFDDLTTKRKVVLTSVASFGIGHSVIKKYTFKLEFNELGISIFEVSDGKRLMYAERQK